MSREGLATPRARGVPMVARALFVVAAVDCASWAFARPVGYLLRPVGRVPYHVVVVDLRVPTVKVSPLLTVRYPGGAEPAGAFIRRYGPTAAITGTYFCTVSLRPIGDIVIDGRLRHFGGMGRALALTPTNEALFVSVPFGRHVDWGGFESVIAAGPTLVRDGRVWLAPRSEGFSDPDVLGVARRCAVGLTGGGKLLLAATNARVTLNDLAAAMRRLGCVDAMALDGGASACLWYRGRYLVKPRRCLVDMLAVFENVDPSRRVAGRPGRLMLQWRAQKAWALYQRALTSPARAVDLLARACELDACNASYCLALASALERTGDTRGAATAYYNAARRYFAKHMLGPSDAAASRATELWPTFPQAIMLRGRIARLRGMLETASMYTQRARALFLLSAVPLASAERMARLREHLENLYGPASQVHMYAVVRGNTASAGGIGLYVELPDNWQWLPSPCADVLVAERAYMPWLVHIVAVGVPPQARMEDITRETFSGTMLFVLDQRPATLGAVPAEQVEARTVAGDEVVRYRIVFAHRRDVLVVMTFAAPERWWNIAEAEFDDILQHSALALRP